MTLAVMLLATLALAQVPTRPLAPVQDGPVDVAPAKAVYAEARLLVQFRADVAATVEAHQSGPGKSSGPATTGLPGIDRLAAPYALQSVARSIPAARNAALAGRLGLDRWFRLEFAAGTDMEALADQLRADPDVEAATPDYAAFPTAVPNDPLYPSQWGHNNTAQMLDYCWGCGGHPAGSPVGTVGFDSNAQVAWDQPQGYGSSSVVIAIIDTGVDIDHPDLLANLVSGWDYGDGDSNPNDDSAAAGHGTACSGVAAAVANNSLGVAGIAGGCSIMPLKVADSAGNLYFSAIVNALVHAADNGADIVSMSLGATGISSDPSTDAAIAYAAAADVVILAATGNENSSTLNYPAINPNVIGVGAASPCGDRKRSSSSPSEVNPGVNTDPNGYTCDGERWWGSNYGSNVQDAAGAVDVIAPTILPTTDIAGSGGYASGDYDQWFNGTSCATPYAAGVCGLIRSHDPGLTRTQVRDQLTSAAIDIVNVESGTGWDRYSGYGMVDAAAALGPAVNPAQISVTPSAMSFTVPLNGTDSAPLTISNVAASPANDLVWTLSGLEAASSSPNDFDRQFHTAGTRTTIDLPLPGDWRIEPARYGHDSRDPALQRHCSDCRLAQKGSAGGGDIEFEAMSVNDGSFEAGSGSGNWTESSTNFGTPLCTVAGCGTGGGTGPRTGSWWCWFGGIAATTEDGAVSQVVTIPAAASVTLRFYTELPSCDSVSDFMEVTIDGNQVFLIDGADATCDVVGYQMRTVDISAYADGGSHTLRFHSTTFSNNGGTGNFFLDDVSMVVETPPCAWMSVVPDNGTTAAGSSDVVTVAVDATGLSAGVYDCELQISSNDPITPLVTVPVQLTVVDAVDVYVSTAAVNPVALFTSPGGSGDPLTAAQEWDGVPGNNPASVDATISVTLTQGGLPVVGHPADQIQLVASAGGWSLCAGTNAADGPTDATGTATFSGPLYGGGHSAPGELIQVVVSGVTLGTVTYAGGGSGLDIRVTSSDINGDFMVNLADVGSFSLDFNGYDFRSDYQWNGIHNLVDLGKLASTFAETCPAAKSGASVALGSSGTSANATIGLYFDRAGTSSVTSLAKGRETTAYLLLTGPAARRGITAWSAALSSSDNVVVKSVTLPEGSLNLGSGDDFVVGTGGVRKAVDGQPLLLGTVRLSVTDTEPAHLTLNASARSTVSGPAISDGADVLAVDLSSGAAGEPVAFLNDDSAQSALPAVAMDLNLRNRPNPFNPSTQILFNLPRTGRVDLRIYDVSGRLVTELGSATLPAGPNQVHWNGTDGNGAPVVSGLYFCQLFLDGHRLGSPQKMSLLK